MGRLNRDEVKVIVDEVHPFKNEQWQGIKFFWSGTIGFGEYTIYQNVDDPDKWKADSEAMDTTEDKWFIRKLMDSFIEQLEVTE